MSSELEMLRNMVLLWYTVALKLLANNGFIRSDLHEFGAGYASGIIFDLTLLRYNLRGTRYTSSVIKIHALDRQFPVRIAVYCGTESERKLQGWADASFFKSIRYQYDIYR